LPIQPTIAVPRPAGSRVAGAVNFRHNGPLELIRKPERGKAMQASPIRFLSFIIAIAMFIVLAGGCANTQTTTAQAQPGAVSDPFENAVSGIGLEEAQRKADADDRLLIVFSTADWCGPCRQMKANTWTDPHVNQWVQRHALVYYLDVDEEGPLSDELEVRSIPTMIAFRNGEELDRITGNLGTDSFLNWLNGLDGQRAAR